MNFEDFQMPSRLISELYRNSLFDAKDGQESPEKSEKIEDYTLGDNQKKILILVKNKSVQVISETDLIVLNKMLAACKLSLRDTAVLNIDKLPGLRYTDFFAVHLPQTVLMLGVTAADIDLPVNFPDFKISSFQQIKMVAAPSLDEIENNREIKLSLWTSLKQLFL